MSNRVIYDLLSPERAQFIYDGLRERLASSGAGVDGSVIHLSPVQVELLAALPEDHDGHIDADGLMWIGGSEFPPATEGLTPTPGIHFSAQAVTVDGYGDYEIVIMPLDDLDGFLGHIATAPLDGDFTGTADLDHALTGAGFKRVSDWEPASFGSIATVVKEG